MKFRLNESGEMTLVQRKSIVQEMENLIPSHSHIIDVREVKEYLRDMKFLKNKAFSVAPTGLILATATLPANGGAGIFWEVFLQYIFPWLCDIAQVYTALRIAQAFYQEKRGGKDEGTGFQALVSHGKFLLLFHLLPWGVELIDQLGESMFQNLTNRPVNLPK